MDPATWAMIGTAAKGAAVGTAAVAPTAATATTAATAGAASTAGLFGSAGSMSLLQTMGTLSKVGSAVSMVGAGKADDQTMKFQVEQEKMRAKEEAIGRRERLLDALSKQSARVGAAGITSIGTPQNIQATDIARFEQEDLAAGVSSRTQQNIYKQRGKSAKSGARVGAGISLLSAGTDLYKIG